MPGLHEIPVTDLKHYVDPWNMEHDCAIAIATDGRETDGLTIGWAGFGVLWNRPMATVYIHRSRYSKHIFDGAEYYSICFMPGEERETVRYFGKVSGRDEDKMKGCGKTVVTDDLAPYFQESRVVILCRMMGKSDFDPDSCDAGVRSWYQRDGVHTQYYGEILKILVSDAAQA